MSEWFEEWFNSNEYLEVYNHRNENDAKKLGTLIIEKLPFSVIGPVLDTACGAGRHVIFIAKKGITVTGIDLSPRLISVANANAKKEKLSAEFLVGDFRKIILHKKYQLILNLFTSIGYNQTDEENFQVFDSVANLLENNGAFVLDYFNINYLSKNLIPYSRSFHNRMMVEQVRRIELGRVIKDIIIQAEGNLKCFKESVALYHPDILRKELQRVGLTIIGEYGDYSGNNFDISDSERFIIFAQKK